MTPYPVQAASPSYAWALTVPAIPGTFTPFPYSVTSCRVPGWARNADTTAASCAGVGICAGPSPGPNGSTRTGIVAEWLWLAAARLSEELSPNAKITAMACAADSRPARSAGPNPASSTSANIPAGAITEAHHGTCWLPTPYAPADLCSTGAASTLPATTPTRHPARAGQPTRL